MIRGQLDFEKMGGLVPAIVQDAQDGAVLMLGFMNEEALRRTQEENEVVFWSRRNARLWKKGETSGNTLKVVSICADCDSDTLLITALPAGPVCHTGARSCFAESPPGFLHQLMDVIVQRRDDRPDGSYTAALFGKGVASIAQKVGEEAVELAIAAQHPDRQRCIEEGADLLYHTCVLLAAKQISLGDIAEELERRRKR
jgi:phosphoribosyl-ATP pyrophosphohydrolase/phosphoribosyl-AMP cyclohydrolase